MTIPVNLPNTKSQPAIGLANRRRLRGLRLGFGRTEAVAMLGWFRQAGVIVLVSAATVLPAGAAEADCDISGLLRGKAPGQVAMTELLRSCHPGDRISVPTAFIDVVSAVCDFAKGVSVDQDGRVRCSIRPHDDSQRLRSHAG